MGVVAYISSKVGVTYRIKVISRNGTWRTECEKNSRLLSIVSSQVAWSKSDTKDAIQMKNLTVMILRLISRAAR